MGKEEFCRLIGGHPLAIAFKGVLLMWVILVALFGLTCFVWIYSQGTVAFLAGGVGILLLVLSLKGAGESIAILMRGFTNWFFYHKAKSQIDSGNLVPSYAYQGTVGICLVDETHKKVFANGHVFAFSDIRRLVEHLDVDASTFTRYRVEFLLKSGAAVRVHFSSEAIARSMEYRLQSSVRAA